MKKTKIFGIGLAILALAKVNGMAASGDEAGNLALSAKYTLIPGPNSPHCAAGDASKKLTDGVYSGDLKGSMEGATDTSIWTMDTTVGWHRVFAPVITLDLGKDQPISGVSYSTAAGRADVSWPQNIFVQTSVDGEEWFTAGDLVALSDAEKAPPKEGRHRFSTRALATHGRFVRLIVIARFYIFCDEIEVFRGDQSLLGISPAGELTRFSGPDWAASYISRVRVIDRVERDAEAVEKKLENFDALPPDERSALRQEIKAGKDEARAMSLPDPVKFKAILPLNEGHARIFSAFGKILGAKADSALLPWKMHRFDPLNTFDFPSTEEPVRLDFELMRGERRSDSFLLTNASPEKMAVTLHLKAPPGVPADQLRTFISLWTDTNEGRPVADALEDLRWIDDVCAFDIPAGLTVKVWVTVDASTLAPGSHEGSIMVRGGGRDFDVPLHLRVSQLAMKTPRLSLGLWDYTSGNGAFGITADNMEASIRSMQASFVDTPWADRSVLPEVSADDFDAKGELMAPLDFEKIDRWVARWPQARHYAVYINAQDQFAGSPLQSPEFQVKVGSWARALSAHMRELKLDPGQLILLLVDEPRNDLHDEIIVHWTRAIKKAAPELTLFTNPIWDDPSKTKGQEAIVAANIVCPNLKKFMGGGKTVASYFAERRASGQSLWFYLCDGPTRNFDPSSYYRLMAWKAFQQGATGIGFWSFGDLGGSTSSWNEYIQAGKSYAPAFLGERDVTNSIHYEAIQEGVQDYEYLAMLGEIAGDQRDPRAREASSLLDEATSSVLASYSTDYKWDKKANRGMADLYRSKVLKFLEDKPSVQDAK